MSKWPEILLSVSLSFVSVAQLMFTFMVLPGLSQCPGGGVLEGKLPADALFALLLLRVLGLLFFWGSWKSRLSPKGIWAGKPLHVRAAVFLPGLYLPIPVTA